MKLYIAPDVVNIERIQIFSGDNGRVICSMNYRDIDLARRLCRSHNGWWHTLFGSPRDAKQKKYDEWIAARNHYN